MTKPGKMKDEIEKLLNKGDTNEVLANVGKIAGGIGELAVIWTQVDDDQIHWVTNGISISKLIFLFESIKFALLDE